MNTPTLGYEDDTKISKSEIAQLQLYEAISLFLQGKYVCATTLAGAAESVLAGLLSQRGEASVVEDSVAAIHRIRKATGLAVASGRPDKALFKDWNAARNQLKHHDMTDDNVLTVNLFDEAYWMIRRALANADKLSLALDIRDEFENWVVININM